MIKITLTADERLSLEKLRLKRSSNVGERAWYVLLSSEGHAIPQIAERTGRSKTTVRLWLKRYLADGEQGLRSRKQPGRPAKLAPAIESALEVLMPKSPKDYGYQEAGWQVNILKDYFIGQGISACDNTIVCALKRKGYVFKRFSKRVPEETLSSKEKKARINVMIDEIKQMDSGDFEVFFGDESHFSNQPYVSRGWFQRGVKKK